MESSTKRTKTGGRLRGWTDEQLADAVRDSRTYAQVARALGLRGGSALKTVKRHIARLGLDDSHFGKAPHCVIVENGEQCMREVYALDWCKHHYRRNAEYGDPLGVPELAPPIPTGTRFGFLTVIERTEVIDGIRRYRCQCDCGNETIVDPGNLRNGRTTTCGFDCALVERGRKAAVFAGETYGRLTVTAEEDERGIYGRRRFTCQCSCDGKLVYSVYGNALQSGNAKSCGCLGIEHITELGKSQRTHGHSVSGKGGSPTYRAWTGMRLRCRPEVADNADYRNYAGRGIKVCARWDPDLGGSFENFLEDMGERPEEYHPSGISKWSLDRIDVNGDYGPENCRWADSATQVNNRRCVITASLVAEAAAQLFDDEQVDALLAVLDGLRVRDENSDDVGTC